MSWGARLIDAGTPSGTYVNDRRVDAFDLVDNDVIRVGSTRLTYESIL